MIYFLRGSSRPKDRHKPPSGFSEGALCAGLSN
jgi:hypothetical protein